MVAGDGYRTACDHDQTCNDNYPKGRDQALDDNHLGTWSLRSDLQGRHRQK